MGLKTLTFKSSPEFRSWLEKNRADSDGLWLRISKKKSAMIQGVQEQLPGYRLRLASVVEAHNNRVRFQWEAGGTAEAPLHFIGTDFGFIADDGRLKSITGFLDQAPGLPAKK
jgi:hypothetical protein